MPIFLKKGGMMQLLYMLTYMNLIFLASTGWNMELKNHYIFLIPESSSKKSLLCFSHGNF